MADSSYRTILANADAFFEKVMQEQPQNLRCGRGCSLCCYGLFEIGSGDIPQLADTLERLHPSRRRAIIRRSANICATSAHPNLRAVGPAEKEAFFERTASTPCPALDSAGACLLYEGRPLVCRTFGLPLRDGSRYLGDVCELNFTEATDGERESAAWDLQWEDVLGPEDEFTIPEAIVLIARTRGWIDDGQ